ncbi:hypothetical protein [Pseudoruegeria sp. SHC-113]|uniref:hypothetical protein n=1 Tax=Pseudoruegeria sp. SHC-113 TaxID=2855439 RepID=UPI0021BB53C1|nr:hypothetical protein [Pseudoruegeria sp. SHC-113]MCT8159560.1 hypothetical protein [Pseudoruegeria sp. SHC-113]
MHRSSQYALVAGLASLLALSPLAAQSPTAEDPAERFDSENAILDTSLPFAIGAQEARQSLRGSFGWPTFQEGLVEGVYFRFDPDGYARFSPAPRLDTDVFEVICRPRTYSCMGRKGALGLFLNARGQLQLRIEGIAEGDTFHIAEGVTEIQLPPRLLHPLDSRFEALLMAGGELVVRRGGEEFDRISLIGFSAVSTYLRWVMARQDYTILPRGWPVPNSRANKAGGITQAASWQSPMPQPQAVLPVAPVAAEQGIAPALQAISGQQDELAEVRSELSMLRALLEEEASASGTMDKPMAPGFSAEQPIGATLHVPLGEAGALEERIARLESAVAALESLFANTAPRAIEQAAVTVDPFTPPTDMGAAGEAAAFGAAAGQEETTGQLYAAPSASLDDFLGRTGEAAAAVAPGVVWGEASEQPSLAALSETLQTAYDVPPDVAQMVISMISSPARHTAVAGPPMAAGTASLTGDPFSVVDPSTDKEMIDLFRTREVDRILAELDASLSGAGPAEAVQGAPFGGGETGEATLFPSLERAVAAPASAGPAMVVANAGTEPMQIDMTPNVPTNDLEEYLTLSAYFKSVLE